MPHGWQGGTTSLTCGCENGVSRRKTTGSGGLSEGVEGGSPLLILEGGWGGGPVLRGGGYPQGDDPFRFQKRIKKMGAVTPLPP